MITFLEYFMLVLFFPVLVFGVVLPWLFILFFPPLVLATVPFIILLAMVYKDLRHIPAPLVRDTRHLVADTKLIVGDVETLIKDTKNLIKDEEIEIGKVLHISHQERRRLVPPRSPSHDHPSHRMNMSK